MIAIEQALNTELLGGGLDLDIVFDNGIYSVWDCLGYEHQTGAYVPSTERGYIESKVFPASILPFSLNHSDTHSGVYQVIVKYPADMGSIVVKSKVDEVLALFGIGSTLTYDSQSVTIDTKSVDGGRVEGGFYQVVVRFEYQAFVTR